MPPVLRYRPGTNPRGEDTRRRLIETAIEVFGSSGYEGATTRVLADRADANLPAIQYYFGSKEGLYRASIDHIVAWIENHLAPASVALEAVLADDGATPPAVEARLHELLDAVVALFVGGLGQDKWCLFLTRTEIEHMAALDPLHEMFQRRFVRPCAAAIGRLTRQAADDPETLMQALAILGQITMFGKKGAQRVLGWAELDEGRVRAIQALVRRNTAAMLRATDGTMR